MDAFQRLSKMPAHNKSNRTVFRKQLVFGSSDTSLEEVDQRAPDNSKTRHGRRNETSERDDRHLVQARRGMTIRLPPGSWQLFGLLLLRKQDGCIRVRCYTGERLPSGGHYPTS
ncbi:hypothetical protein TNCV_4578411 [Trichonephila clavipes]|nr:hypothetical protein TNCV_4578411 [Trichonephila clavipes]